MSSYECNDVPAAPLDLEAANAKMVDSTFSWHGVEYIVGSRKGQKKILSNISGSLGSGEVCALMGPSGAGKTSLLNVLAGRLRTRGEQRVVNGTMRLDGRELSGSALRKRIAYVMQQDLLYETQTPREALMFSARMRLPSSVPLAEKRELVDKMLRDLGLTKCADTPIGNELRHGISGGERKRTSVGVELITHPTLVFLDEPTSGLDSYVAHAVVSKLRDLASRAGCNVLCTIHQPSSEVFHSFNKVIVLREGQMFFFGAVQELSSQLNTFGHGCPAEYNLADHVMFIMMSEKEEAISNLQGNLQRELKEQLANLNQSGAKPGANSAVDTSQPRANIVSQLSALTLREAQRVWRDKAGLIASIVIPLVLNLIYAFIFFQVGDVNQANYDSQSHFGAVAQVAIGGMMGAAQPLLVRFPLERGIFLREYSAQTYGVAAYFVSKSMVELPQSFLNAVIVWLSCYFIMGLHGSFVVYILVFWITGMAAASTALLVGSVATNAEVANQASPAIFVPQMLFAGFFIKIDNIPVWLRWPQYLCSLKYGMNLYLLNEFGEATRSDWPADHRALAETFITSNDVDPSHAWVYVVILIGMISVLRLISILALARKARSFF